MKTSSRFMIRDRILVLFDDDFFIAIVNYTVSQS